MKIASAIALGEIGGSEAAIAWSRASIYDHKEEVRKASSTALERLNTKAKAAFMLPPGGPSAAPPLPPASSPSPFRQSAPPSGPGSEPPPGMVSQPESSPAELIPPPPPTPVASGPGGQVNR